MYSQFMMHGQKNIKYISVVKILIYTVIIITPYFVSAWDPRVHNTLR